MAKQVSITDAKYINDTELAKHLCIGSGTLTCWIKAGKLPKPAKSILGDVTFPTG